CPYTTLFRSVICQHRPVTIQDLAAQTFRTQTAQAVLFRQAQEVFSLEDLELPRPPQQQAETDQHDRQQTPQATSEAIIIWRQRPLDVDDLLACTRSTEAAIACHGSSLCPDVYGHTAWRSGVRNRRT